MIGAWRLWTGRSYGQRKELVADL